MFMGFKHPGTKNAVPGQKTTPTQPAAEVFVPAIPLPAIFSFAVIGFGGALFLSYSFFPAADATSSARSPNDVPVYSVPAVPRDSEKAATPEESVSATKRVGVAQTEPSLVEIAEPAPSSALVSSSTRSGFKGFDAFSNSNAPDSYLALARTPMGVSVSAESNSSGHSAPDAENLSSVPEPSTWLAGAALVALVGARWLRSKWRRSRRSSR